MSIGQDNTALSLLLALLTAYHTLFSVVHLAFSGFSDVSVAQLSSSYLLEIVIPY